MNKQKHLIPLRSGICRNVSIVDHNSRPSFLAVPRHRIGCDNLGKTISIAKFHADFINFKCRQIGNKRNS